VRIDGERHAARAIILIRFEDRASVLMRWIACALAATVTAGAAAAVDPGATPRVAELTAAQIVEKNVAARGGLEAWRKIQTMVWLGHMQSEHAPVPVMQFVLQQQRPNKMRFEINAMGERSIRVFDGVRGWKLRPGHTGKPDVQTYSPQEVTYAFRSSGIDGPLIDYQAKGNTVSLEALDEIEGRRAYRLVVTLASGETDHIWVDAQTFLEVRYDRPSYSSGNKPATVSVFYRDFKAIEGLQIPMTIETPAAPGQPPDKMVIERVVMNTPLEDRTFVEPGAKPHRRSGLSMNHPAPAQASAPPDASRPDPGSAPGSK
jgi:outer membrane lipoprotein-sorting protein